MKKSLIIGIAGGTGSGKTTLVNQLINKLPANQVCVLSQDAYYKATDNLSLEQRNKINFDHPNSIDFKLLVTHLKALKNNKTILQPVYSFITHNRTKKSIKTISKKVIIIEGILIFSNQEVRNLCDIKLFVDADADERLIRRIKRDTTERGRTIEEVLNRYQDTLKPMHQQFIEPTQKFADVIIPNNRYNTVAVEMVKTIINQQL